MRNLIVCCDGTWNTPDQEENGIPAPTNVVRLYNALPRPANADGVAQLTYYHPGVGTEGTWWQKLAGGATGSGLSDNIKSAYRWLAAHYQSGDRIYLFGFSRGAYTVRSLAGMVGQAGLLNVSAVADNDTWKRVEAAFTKGYGKRQPRDEWSKDWAFHSASTGTPTDVSVHFLGVWDTVGALGIPNDMAVLNLLDDIDDYAFHDTTLGHSVRHARQAVAADEMRASFAPTLWDNPDSHPDVKQLWFPGVHSDVGGGYVECGLADGALKWMMDEAQSLGLGFHPGLYHQVVPDCRGLLHDSRNGLFKVMRSQPRSVPQLKSGPALHDSILDRQSNPPITQGLYRPTIDLAPGATQRCTVFASQPWNDTGIYLYGGATYQFSASGQWLDRNIKCGPAGTTDGKFHAGEIVHLAGTLWGKIESGFKQLSGNEEADFRGSRREETLPWFCLVGVIANGANPQADGTPATHEIIPIKDGCSWTASKSGYLYCFANDAWNFYSNNRGSVELMVKRTG